MLLRSWIEETGLAQRVAWVSVPGEERDPQRFWLTVADALRSTPGGGPLVRALTAAPELDAWGVVERLAADLAALEDQLWLVIDDVHELRSGEARRQLELLLLRSPAQIRYVLAARHDPRLGLHRLRLEGDLTEIRAADLRFSLEESRELLQATGVELSDSALTLLVERTEGWAAGLRLAALSLAGHPDPERFAAEFSGSDRTVADYLLAEVLDRQPEEVRALLLRTSVLEQVCGPIADLLSGVTGGERILLELEEANAFVYALDGGRTWFRYHQLFADLLRLELRRTAPGEIKGLHRAAADWFAGHAYPIEAIRHAQAAENWNLAARLLSDHWFSLELDGQAAAARELLRGFPPGAAASGGELAALLGAQELHRGSLEQAERHLATASRGSTSVAEDRRGHFEVMLAVLRLSLARQRSDLPVVAEEAQRLLEPAEATETLQFGLTEDLRALALLSLGISELWADRLEEAERHLAQGIVLARRIERPYLEINGLAHSAMVAIFRSWTEAAERSEQAIALARRHGWSEEQVAALAYLVLAGCRVWQGRLEEADDLVTHGERTLRGELQPATGVWMDFVRGLIELARGRDDQALLAFRSSERLGEQLVVPHAFASRNRRYVLQTLVRMGEGERAEQAYRELGEGEREAGEMRTTLALLRIARRDPKAATVALAPVLDGTAPLVNPHVGLLQAFLLEAIARDELGERAAAERALERALDLAEPDGALLPFLLHPMPELLASLSRHATAHGALISEILMLLEGHTHASPSIEPNRLREPLSQAETRVLRYLPTNLSVPEIADQLYLSVNTVKTHLRHLYDKLGANRRGQAVERARALGLLAPSLRRVF